ncbi:MAG: 30S ribosomal protein S15 [Candidatus Saganbacteria bacterium]|nr:30S ribosomal protein S15 [Candidatus Saganbacteria bacterium]
MALVKEKKAELIHKFGINDKDNGSAPVQIAILTARINSLVGHLHMHKKDNHTRRGLLLLVGRRKRLLRYVERVDFPRYESLVKELGL